MSKLYAFFDVSQHFQYTLVCWSIYAYSWVPNNRRGWNNRAGGGGGWTLLFGTREYLRSIASLFLVNEISREDWTRKLKKGYSKDTWENTKYFFFARFLSFSPYCSHFLSLSLYLSLSGTINPKMTKINPPLLHSLHLFNFGSPASFFHLRVSQVIHLL